MRHLTPHSHRLQAIVRGTLAALLLLLTAAAASAQALTQNQGPNLGTWTIGNIDLQLQASGGAGNGTYVWSLIGGTLPTGVSLRTDVPSYYAPNASAGLIGIATAPGSYGFTLRVTSGGQTVDRAYTWKITGLTLKDNNLPDAFVGQSYSYQLTALNNAGPVTWTTTNTLPQGLTLSPGGLLSGVPATAGFFNVNFRIDDGVDVSFPGRGLSVFAIEIVTDGALLPNATQGAAYATSIIASGGTPPYTFAACSGNTINCVPGSSALPNGLTLDSGGAISGIANTGAGKFSFTVTATDANHVSVSKLMAIDVVGTPAALPNINPYGSLFDDCAVGLTCSLGLSVNSGGEAPFTWSATGLPTGMSIRTGSGVTSQYITPGDGELWGVPTVANDYPVQVTVTDNKGVSSSNTFVLHVSPMWLANFLQNGTIGVPYSSKLRVIGGVPPYSVVMTSGTLPAGLTFDANTFTVSGTPLENSQANFSFDPMFRFTDAAGKTFTHHSYFSIAAGPTSTITISNGNNLGARTLNVFFSQTLTACCLPAFTWSVVGGSMPPGVGLSAGGVLSGTPTAEGTFTFLVQVADPANSANVAFRQFTLVVTSLSPSVASFTLPFGNVGAPYSTPLAGAGVTGLTWRFTDRTYPPPGVVVDSATGLLHGTPTASGQYFFSVDISDGAGRTVSRGFGISIYPAGVNPPLSLLIGPNFGPLVNGNFTQQLAATGGLAPYHYSLTPGAPTVPGMRVQDGQPLPTNFNSPGGFIGLLADSGVFSTSIRVTDSAGAFFDRPITMTVSPHMIVSSSPWPRAYLGVPYAFSLAQFGGVGPFTYSINPNTTFPPGLSLDAQGHVSGTPTSTGGFSPSIVLTDIGTSKSITQSFSVVVDSFGITTANILPQGVVGTPYTPLTFTASGCGAGCTWTPINFNGAGGLNISAAGVLSGTPTNTVNTFFTLQASGPGGVSQKAFSLQVVASTVQPLVITNTSLGPNAVGNTVTQSLSAAGGTPPYTWSVQSGALPPGITLQSGGENLGLFLGPGFSYLAGRAMQDGAYTFTLAVTDAANTTATRTLTWNISRLSFQYFNLPIVNTPLINKPLVYNTPYSQPLLALGGTGSYTWALNTPLPPGLRLDGATGVVSGTPTNTGSLQTSIQATDTNGKTNTNFVTFNVSGPTATTLGFSSGPSFGLLQQGFSTSFNVTPIGGTPPYTVTATTPIPSGFALLSGDSLLGTSAAGTFFYSGMPLTSGPATFTLQAQDSVGNIGVRTFTYTVVPYTLAANALHDGSVGVPYSQSLVVFNGSGLVWSPSITTPLPNGLSVSPSGVISGTPQSAGNFNFTLVAIDAVTDTSLSSGFSLRISRLSIADSAILPQTAIVGQPFSYTFTGAGGNAIWSATGLPNGLTMSATGTIGGTPTNAGTSSILVTATDGLVPISRRFTLFTRLPNPSVLDFPLVSTALPDVTVGQSTTLTLTANGGLPPYHFTVASGSSLPPGLQLVVADGNLANFLQGATVLIGTPTTPGPYTFDLIITDSAPQPTAIRRTFTLNVSAISIVTGAPRTATTGVAYSERFTAVGGTAPYSFTMSPVSLTIPMLPTGLQLAGDGVIAGTPTSTGSYGFILRARDMQNRSFARVYTLQVNSPSGLAITTNNPPDTWVGSNQGFGLSTNGPSTYTWSVISGSLPTGMSLMSFGSSTSIAGASTVPNTYTFTLRAVDVVNAANSADRTFTFRVSPMQPVSPPLEISNVIAVPAGQVGAPYSFTFKIVGGVPPYSIAPSALTPLPTNMSFNGTTLAGTPQTPGNYVIGAIVSDAAGHTLNLPNLGFMVTPAGVAAPLVRAGNDLFDGSVGVPFAMPLVESSLMIRGGTAPFTWSVSGGSTLPPGLALLPGGNGFSNILGGVPTAAGGYDFSLIVNDASGQSLTIPFSLSISPLALSPSSVMLPPGVTGTNYSMVLVPSGGSAPYTFQLDPSSAMPPGLTLSAGGQLAGVPSAPGNFPIFGQLSDSAGHELFFVRILTVDNPAGEAPALTTSPRPIQVFYTTGGPAPAPVPITFSTTSGNLPFNAVVAGIPGATLSAGSGTTSTAINLNVPTLAVGSYTGVVAATASDAANHVDFVPVTVTVSAPVPCTLTINPQAASMPATGGPGSFGVSTAAGCSWSTTGPPPSVATITAGATGSGSGTVSYTVVPNTGTSSRTLIFAVGGQQHVVTQFGSACSFAINPSKLTVSAAGGAAQISVTPSLSSCSWTASGLGATPASGTGAGVVTVTIPPNTAIAPVNLSATIAGKTLTINQAGAGCTVGLSPYNASAASDGGPGSIGITTPAGCAYDTTSAPSWISITSGGAGTASGTLVYNVTPNSTTVPRVGSLTIGGQTFQLTQDALACSVTVDTSRLGSPYGSAGGTGIIGITTNGANCHWTASSDSSWTQINTAGGTGSGSVGLTIQSNAASVTGRTAAITINGQTVNLQQSGTACTFALQSSTGSVPASGGAGSVGVIAPAVCTWGATSSDPTWLAITSAGGAGSSDVQFVAQPNPLTTQRSATLTIAGLTYTVTEAGAPCTYTMSGSTVTVAATGASGSFTFSTPTAGCSPNPVSYANWITATPTFNGTSGSVQYIVQSNPGTSSRVGTIRVGEQNFTVTETGGACGFSLNSYNALIGPAGDSTRTVFGSPSALGCTPTVGTNQPSFIELGSLFGPANNIFTLPYTVSPFNSITPSLRFGNITFGGQIFVVKQTSY